ncbi:cyclic nucleotide-gated cation channel beta-1 [Trichonephila inaurata madagascariensis]|uniref:Cyclic nucleotide-gated cation channel beta-1 n=1 Tax=Trichonephila inaurata madagascariensis TaxID=2747483 RepID=A0A8X6Y4V5_9ARAC|nr:cyclic nucleotide-gated cation channel beta-1 [Trichonephila inaurata madagascariensis]
MSIEQKLQSLQTLSLPEEQRWMEAERSAFIARKIQGIVQAFQYRAEKAKEKLVQPPTPSPSPPFESSSDNDPTSPIRQSRPRLQSLIEEEKSSVNSWSQSISFFCCSIKKKFIPTFPKIIDPQSKLYIIWLFFVMMSYAYNAWSIIFRAVFPYQTPDNTPIFLAFDYIADIIYVLDIALFKVRLQFLHNGFWVVQTFWEFFNRVDAVTKTPYVIRIIRTLMYMMYLIHLNACAYYAMSTWEGIGSNRWVFQGDGNAYIRCFYFATKTATSIGKNPKPENEIEYIFMTISWLMGVFIFAFLVGQIRDIVATATQSRTQYRQLMDQTVMYMRNLNLPDELQRRVRMWLNHNWEQQKTFNVGRILDTLPRKMKTDVAINVHYKTLVKVQLFKDCDKALLRDLVLQLRPVLFLPGDYICRKGEVGKEMYIVNKGIVEVLGGENGDVVLATLTKGSVFGEISLLGIPGCNRRTADVRSKGFSNLFVLSKDDLWEALKNYPEAQKVLRKKAKNIIKENEARAQAARARQGSSATAAGMQRQPDEIEKSYTPKLVRTVMQVLPKSYHRIQPQSNNSTKTSFATAPTMATSRESNNTASPCPYKPIPYAVPKSIIRKHKIRRPMPSLNPNPPLKPRSMSDSILRIPVIPQEALKSDNRTFDFPYIIKKISPTKSDPCSYRQLDSEDSPTINTRQVFSHSAPHQRQPQTLFSEDSEEDQEISKHSSLNEDVQEMVLDNQKGMGSDLSSETSSTSTQKLTIDNSDDDNSSSGNCSWISSNSSIPYLGNLFHQDSLNSAASSIKEIHSPLIPLQEPENKSIANNPKVLMNNNDEKNPNSPCLSNSSSVLYLGGLFHHSSSQSSNSSNKDLPLSPYPQRQVEDSETSTNGSSSAGYDNLAFVPSGIFSRRSSMFSNASG